MPLIKIPLLALSLLFDQQSLVLDSRLSTPSSLIHMLMTSRCLSPGLSPRPLWKRPLDYISWLPQPEQNSVFPKTLSVPFPLNPAPPSIVQISGNGTTIHLEDQVPSSGIEPCGPFPHHQPPISTFFRLYFWKISHDHPLLPIFTVLTSLFWTPNIASWLAPCICSYHLFFVQLPE